MRRILVDTNVWLRRAQHDHEMHQDAAKSVDFLLQDGAILCMMPQNLYEFWTVTTRPVTSRNGFGWTPTQCETEIEKLLQVFSLLTTSEADILREWRRLVSTYNVSGVAAHDARLVAAMTLYRVEEILTFNTKDFARYAVEKVRVLDPQTVAATS